MPDEHFTKRRKRTRLETLGERTSKTSRSPTRCVYTPSAGSTTFVDGNQDRTVSHTIATMDDPNGSSWVEPPVVVDSRRRKPLPPVIVNDPNDPAAMKRARNTLAARKSRQKRDRRMLEMQQKLAVYENGKPVSASSPTSQKLAPNGLANSHNPMTLRGQPNSSSRNQSVVTYETSENDDDVSLTPEHLREETIPSSGDSLGDHMDTERSLKEENGYHVPASGLFNCIPDRISATLREVKLPDLSSHATYEASLAQERGKEAETPCKHCAQTNGPGGIFNKCVVLDGFFDGACANCKSDSMPYRCTFHQANRAPDLKFRELPENMSKKIEIERSEN